jgi:hypothetical protein
MKVNVVNQSKTALFFIELSKAVAQCFLKWGHQVSHSTQVGQVPANLEIIFGDSPIWRRSSGRTYVYWHLEQLPTSDSSDRKAQQLRADREERLNRVLKVTDIVLDLSCSNVKLLRSRGVRAVHCPIGYHESFDKTSISSMPIKAEVLFLGSKNSRRKEIVRKIPADVSWWDNLWGKARDNWITGSKVNLNLHVTSVPFVEYHRIVLLTLSSCKFCVSEPLGKESPFINGEHLAELHTGDVDGWYRVLQDEIWRQQIAKNGYSFVKEYFRLEVLLKKALAEVGIRV